MLDGSDGLFGQAHFFNALPDPSFDDAFAELEMATWQHPFPAERDVHRPLRAQKPSVFLVLK